MLYLTLPTHTARALSRSCLGERYGRACSVPTSSPTDRPRPRALSTVPTLPSPSRHGSSPPQAWYPAWCPPSRLEWGFGARRAFTPKHHLSRTRSTPSVCRRSAQLRCPFRDRSSCPPPRSPLLHGATARRLSRRPSSSRATSPPRGRHLLVQPHRATSSSFCIQNGVTLLSFLRSSSGATSSLNVL
ncbi:hypothetical protein TOPH_03045 [Tolypocladium ophioglossoides CBS 100239]|uniref:Uncharacterized protein n=1 Tax=Tolypocladium ophioglossoides (strain CBS 100239) TaxID=1163406 RepID=A0A0L0NE65_TOLOC|nr:hypothetical protein TOPH_03045 [Tolypocladium ophioglossoides CBS 100239]